MEATGVEAVVFDLDGTLFDHLASSRFGVAELVASLGGAITSALEAAWFAAEDHHFTSWINGECSWEEQRRRRVREFPAAPRGRRPRA